MTNTYPQLFAGILAIGGLFWALFLAVLGVSGGVGGVVGVILYFGIGYLVWAGWILRAFWTFRFGFRVALWVTALVYNGAYFLSHIGGFRSHTGELPLYWWGTTSIISAFALTLERQRMPNQSSEPTLASGTSRAR